MPAPVRASPGFTLSALLPVVLLGALGGCTSDRPSATAIQTLQGTWEGFALERQAPTGPYVKSGASKITIEIDGSALHFHRDADFWWDTTITLPAGTDPQHLRATIQRPEESRGEVVIAFFKIEGETLTLGGIRDGDSTGEWPDSFESAEDTMAGRYELQKVRPR